MEAKDCTQQNKALSQEVENNIEGMEPHDVRQARKIIAMPHDPMAEESMMRLLARAVVRYYEQTKK